MDMWTEDQMRSIGKMLNPRSIAVVGASAKGGYGGRLLNAVLKAKDRVRIYPVNPNYDEIAGVKSYRSIADLPEAPDLMGIVVPYNKVLDVLKESHQKGAGSALVISAGFAERGTDSGLDLQRQIGAFARESGLRVAGPNCLGLANVRDDIWATASSRTLGGLTGHIALVCQSGATAFGPFLLRAVDAGIGLSHIISTGNETDLDFADFARYLIDDPETRVIAGFVEGFKDVQKFIAVARLAAERGKPIVLIKIGRSESGAQAARSHTAAMTGADALYEAAFRQYGVIRVQDYDELLEVAHLLAHNKKPQKRGIAVVSHSGGISSLTADMLGQAGLDLPRLSEHARDGINGILKDFGWAANPADVTGFARGEHFPQIMDYMIEEPAVGTLVIASAGAGNQIEQVIALRDRTDKNVAFFFTASRNDKVLAKLKDADIPIFYSPQKLASGLKSLIDYHAWRDDYLASGRAEAPALTGAQTKALEKVRGLGRLTLSESESKQLIAAWGVPSSREASAQSAGGAVEAARRLGYPVALKADSPDILHKTEAGVVRLGLASDDDVRAAYDEIVANAKKYAPNAPIPAVSVQEMVTGGVEVIVGIKYDAQLGPMLLFGSGGVMVEVFNDVALRHCPITSTEAHAMIAEVKGAKLLRGFRGKPPADVDALAEVLVHVSQMAVQLQGRLAELDINPLMVLPAGQGVKAVDALVVLEGKSR
ncbi:MAG TPA: acetate--CoA ligase family protein [Burkholderiales bacterium]|nr:acetate--CoA ligase family protein [Burkholderiales bacterium]